MQAANTGKRTVISIRPVFDSDRPKVYLETYGCQMNVNDSEVVVAIMQKAGYSVTKNIGDANLILINTCSVRDNAEQRVWGRLEYFRQEKKKRPNVSIGLIGCMAERLKESLLENNIVDVVVGPDAYRELPKLVEKTESGQKGINVLLSRDETYSDISPVRLDKTGVTAFISIMRGCNNVCAFCVVPYTRGGERSRNPETVLRELKELSDNGYREVTLLGQNVDSYSWKDVTFAGLLAMVAESAPEMRVRFSTSHPRDMTDDVLKTMAKYGNICNYIHLPVQSGSSAILQSMNRKYTREEYLQRIKTIREIMPDCAVSTDIIAGFCGETQKDHEDTLSLMREVGYDFAYMFKYSERPNTKAARHFKDDVPEDVKIRRLTEIIELQSELSLTSHKKDVGSIVEVLVEDTSKRSENDLCGRTPQNKTVVFPKGNNKIGDLVKIKITDCSQATLKGFAISGLLT
ncbi:MAG: tRNA (N6-isopentenyl adenosine(37)-C2)-methylthiotransferase MiaB [Prevotellaceae bacterium]|jgi:tRNA-2-methylthio-N6-dimethylallyladenosine synthase|nr:tRNA (N6-isopentenyl adenosine(37)-C2)-methylthiotransferase MiaB [Prevotellaceae bacterium]